MQTPTFSPTPNFNDPEIPVQSGDGVSAALDEKKDALARGFDAAAAALEARADSLPGGPKAARAAQSAAEAMAVAADYVRDQDFEDMVSDVQEIAKRHPGVTLLTAAALGFLLARIIARN
jgi:hypothetical protein